jgi:hypothetical protein
MTEATPLVPMSFIKAFASIKTLSPGKCRSQNALQRSITKHSKDYQPVLVDISDANVRAAWMSFRALLSLFISNEVNTCAIKD